jgi:endonuclease/exonuclease/phosphatase family metal-dependent hydrolase
VALALVTWNVLHRVHAVNWDEGVIAAHADEQARIAAIARWIVDVDADVVCLQEVSGDLLEALRDAERHVFATCYPRVPRYYRRSEPQALRDPTEYLVTISRRGGQPVTATAFASDPGKGYQVVELDGVAVIDTHVSWGERHAAQCAELARVATAIAGPVVLCGDFNADLATCAARLPGLAPAVLGPERVTRPRHTPSERSETIDHVFVRGLAILGAAVLDAHNLSDHHPVRVELA